jgi:hypothetical protein
LFVRVPALICLSIVAAVAALVSPTRGNAAQRMPIGFMDDPAFRWSADAPQELDKAKAAHASIVRTIANWSTIAPRRPVRATNPFDPAYRLNDLDELVRNAQTRGIVVMITIWGTPKWANGGKSPNVAPKRAADLTNFARALASRYSGRYADYPYVGRWSVWNEPNLGIFLTPQFGAKGKIVSPSIYATLYQAGYRGIMAGNPHAHVAIGETSNQGRDHPLKGVHDSVAPGTFARLLAQHRGLKFAAYATHPYPTRPNLAPSQQVRWPNVTLSRLPQFETSLDAWFHRRNIPVWITEYGYETKPLQPFGVTPTTQARYLSTVLAKLRADPRVHMFVWFIFRDSPQSAWHSGLIGTTGKAKPALRTFAGIAGRTIGASKTITPGVAPVVDVALPEIAAASEPGSSIAVSYRVYLGTRLVASHELSTRLLTTQGITVRPAFKPLAGKTYTLRLVATDESGDSTSVTDALVAPAPPRRAS